MHFMSIKKRWPPFVVTHSKQVAALQRLVENFLKGYQQMQAVSQKKQEVDSIGSLMSSF